jgi:hypothetical protein
MLRPKGLSPVQGARCEQQCVPQITPTLELLVQTAITHQSIRKSLMGNRHGLMRRTFESGF